MTVIVANRRVMAADSACSVGEVRFDVKKVHPVRGCLVGMSGDSRWENAFLGLFQKHGPTYFPPNEMPTFGEDEPSFDALVVTPDGMLLNYDSYFSMNIVESPAMSVGAGALAAMAVLEHIGNSDDESIEAACLAAAKSCNGCAPPVNVYLIDDAAHTLPKTRKKRQ